ncbi:uncharacterized protein N7459_005875 [Penicillium hispanicum]|uniref:uncharacterized protein n=1 Tax=Penicillium hispanicum TaxID=1080232 RepID=UPI0025404515|nr:uncharacterized protein N7459_005875 [Penicillium hispanicum]KAJ5579890.1 hypothetical protein N7459_005875 [Penicillium hispanicum]
MPSADRGPPGRFFLLCLGLLLLLLPGQAYQKLSDGELKGLPRPEQDFDIHNGAILAPILQTRVPGTPGHSAVLDHFVNFLRSTLPKWEIRFQNSTSKTPTSRGKDVPFTNLIATRDPPDVPMGDVERLTLVAHYDSKLEPKGFIGAIDSAAPCAMIMHAMRSIDTALDKKWAAMREQGIDTSLEEQRGIQVLFLDGEEAFKEWNEHDSLYGARSLAQEWDQQIYPAMSTFKTPLSSISLFVLLDLLGSSGPNIQSYYPTTHWAYQSMASLEQRLRSNGQLKSQPGHSWFIDSGKDAHQIFALGGIQDDHLPFLARGVEILHVIDFSPFRGFPSVWHTSDDDAEHLDMDTVKDWSMIVTAFAAEFMELGGYFDLPANSKERRDEELELEAIRLNRKTEL